MNSYFASYAVVIPEIICSIILGISARKSLSSVRTVPFIVISLGMTLNAVPASITEHVKTKGLKVLINLLFIV